MNWRAWQLPATVWTLGAVSFLNDSASELVYPLLPLYLTSVLMAGPRVLGLIEGIAEATGSLLKLFSGVMTDRLGSAKSWVVTGYGLATLGRPLLALASTWPLVLVLRFADRVGKGLRTAPRDALLARTVPDGQRGLAFGVHRALDNAGAVVGPLLAAVLLTIGLPLRDILLLTLIPGLLALGLGLTVREPPSHFSSQRSPYAWTWGKLPSSLRRYLLAVTLFTLGNSSNMFLLLRARELGLSEAQVPLLWAVVSAAAMLLSAPLSALSDHFGRRPLIIAGWLIYAGCYLVLGLSGNQIWYLWLVALGYGLFMAATEGAERALVADLAPQAQLGTAYGWFNLLTGLMLLPASLIFGWLWQALSATCAFAFSGACALIAAGLVWRLGSSQAAQGQ
ncbi:MFS transporter [Caldichromatium japonicum]|uniref:MFS transporter n=2 Tax=Caldichromatium japonicum TaxID=2699430 RepID=A0A6G7VH69_9GAMM|nr:MFS transporter [Caldichromatium japonicum]